MFYDGFVSRIIIMHNISLFTVNFRLEIYNFGDMSEILGQIIMARFEILDLVDSLTRNILQSMFSSADGIYFISTDYATIIFDFIAKTYKFSKEIRKALILDDIRIFRHKCF